jgi:hypothetical protein
VVNGDDIKIYAQKDPAQIPWKNHEVDVVLGMHRLSLLIKTKLLLILPPALKESLYLHRQRVI